jgi:hypothetical protein
MMALVTGSETGFETGYQSDSATGFEFPEILLGFEFPEML